MGLVSFRHWSELSVDEGAGCTISVNRRQEARIDTSYDSGTSTLATYYSNFITRQS